MRVREAKPRIPLRFALRREVAAFDNQHVVFDAALQHPVRLQSLMLSTPWATHTLMGS